MDLQNHLKRPKVSNCYNGLAVCVDSMSNKKRRLQGMMPINTLSSGLNGRGNSHRDDSGSGQKRDITTIAPPRRYKEFRKDPLVVEELNDMSTGGFLTLGREEDSRKRQNNGQGDPNFESMGETPLRRSTQRANGVLFPSPIENEARISNAAATTIKLLLGGTLRTLDVRKQWDERTHCLMQFTSDSEGPRVSFTHRSFEIKNAQLEFVSDCELVVFDKGSSCIGLILREPRFIDMDNRSKIGRAHTRLFMWMSTAEGKESKIRKIKDVLIESEACTPKLVGSKSLVAKKLDQVALQDYKDKMLAKSADEAFEKIKTKFWEKGDFPSLGHHKRLSQFTSSASHKIPIPKTTVIHDLDQTVIPQITPTDFFKKSSSPGDSNDDKSSSSVGHKNDTLEGLRRSERTRSQSPALRQSKLWDLDSEKDFETPEVFKPKLRYKFADGASYTVTNQDFKCLYNHDWINDSILDFFTKYYAERAIEERIMARDDVYVMSSFFYTKLISDPSDYYGNVKKWVNNCDLFKKKFVVVPINITFHWFGCIITNLDVLYNHLKASGKDPHTGSHPLQANDGKTPNTTVLKDDGEISISTPIVTVLAFDSLRQTHGREIDPIKEFLIAYAKDKYSIDIDKTLIKMKTCIVPQQPNMSDCGVHVILNTKKFFEDPVATMQVWRSTKTRSKATTKVVNEYFDKASREKARKNLRNILWDLQKKQMEIMHERNENIPEEDSSIKDEEEDDGDIEILENYHHIDKQIQIQNPTQVTSGTLSADHESDPASQPSEARVSQKSIESADRYPGNCSNSKDEELNIDKRKVVYHSGRGAPQRHVLESSPMREKSSDIPNRTSKEVSSPYFGESPLKKRAPSFGFEAVENLLPPPHSSFVDTQRSDAELELRTRSSSLNNSESPIMLTNETTDGRNFAVDSDQYERHFSSRSSSSNEAVVVSDLEQDDDVNLVGEEGSNNEKGDDSLTHIREEVERELNENMSQIKDKSASLNRPNTRRGAPASKQRTEKLMNNDGPSPERLDDEGTNIILISHEDNSIA